MELLNKVKDYLLPEEFEFHVYKNKIHIVNFTSIGQLGSEKIIVRNDDGFLTIKGNNLVLKKLISKELLIKGEIKQIEFR